MIEKSSPSILRIFLLTTVFILCTILPVQAKSPVVLDTKAKQPSDKTTAGESPAAGSAGWVSLGQQGNINAVKKRFGKSEKKVRYSKNFKKIKKRISSKSAIIIDAETGETLFAKNPDSPRQPASTIKVLTGMIAIKSLKNEENINVSPKASRMPRSKIYLDMKKQYTANDLINAVLMASANDASVALAEKIAGNEKDFAQMMTLRAKLWGAKQTVCRTATGLTAKGQHSTARDLATIFRHAMEDDEFSQRMQKVKVRTSYGKTLRSHNKALWRVEGAEGGKTGYTAAARQTYVGKFNREEGAIIVAIMGSETMWSDVKNLVEYGFVRKQQIAKAKLEKSRLAQAK